MSSACTLGEYRDFDWSVWIGPVHILASYDSSHSVFSRLTGERLWQGFSLDNAKLLLVGLGVGVQTPGESYATGYAG